VANLNIIRDICLIKKTSLKDLAKQVGISEMGLHRILQTNSTKINTLEKIANVLDVKIEAFFEDEIKYNYEFLIPDYLILDKKITFLSKRYSRFYERINFYKDYYFYSVIVAINQGFKPYYKCLKKEISGKVLNDHHIEIIKILDEKLNLEGTPFSQLSLQHRSEIDSTLIFDGFYFPIFDINFLNISEYLEDGMITNEEIVQYWKDWKNK